MECHKLISDSVKVTMRNDDAAKRYKCGSSGKVSSNVHLGVAITIIVVENLGV